MSLSIWDRSFCYNLERLLLLSADSKSAKSHSGFPYQIQSLLAPGKGKSNAKLSSTAQQTLMKVQRNRYHGIPGYQFIDCFLNLLFLFSGALNNNVFVIVFPTNRYLFSSMYKLVKLVHSVHRDQCSFNDILKQVATKVYQNS